MHPLLSQLREDLTDRIDARNQEGAKRFFKEAIDSYGIRMSDTRLIAKEYFRELKGADKQEVFGLCEDLWASGKMEEAHIAAFWCYSIRKQFVPADLKIFERWIDRYVTNWANCDNFCNNVLGAFFTMYPRQVATLKTWTKSRNRWMRRAAASSLVGPARKGVFLEESFVIAQLLFKDTDDLVQKSYGWLLKEQCKKHADAVFQFLLEHKAEMPRTALRYAAEKLPAMHRQEVIAR